MNGGPGPDFRVCHLDGGLTAVPEHAGVRVAIHVHQIGIKSRLPGQPLKYQCGNHPVHVSFAAARDELFIEHGKGTAGRPAIVGEEIRPAADRQPGIAVALDQPTHALVSFQTLDGGFLVHLIEIDQHLFALLIMDLGAVVVKFLEAVKEFYQVMFLYLYTKKLGTFFVAELTGIETIRMPADNANPVSHQAMFHRRSPGQCHYVLLHLLIFGRAVHIFIAKSGSGQGVSGEVYTAEGVEPQPAAASGFRKRPEEQRHLTLPDNLHGHCRVGKSDLELDDEVHRLLFQGLKGGNHLVGVEKDTLLSVQLHL